AYASRLKGDLVVIGRDTRASGPLIASAVSTALRFKGIGVVDLGVASTPTVEIMVVELGAAGGVIVTASHNGPEWNALKFLDSGGEFLSAAAMAEIKRRALGPEHLFDAPKSFGALDANDTGDAIHIGKILELGRIDRRKIAARKLKAVVDCVNGAGSRILPSLLRSLGLRVVELYTDVEAPFPHDPEPKPQNLAELSEAVRREKADIGFACDPDGDRLVLVDETGSVLSEELTLAIAADFVLREEKGPLVANLSTSRVLDDVGAARGASVYRSKVGEAHVTALMKKKHAAIGGEGNGGVIYPKLHYGRDAMVGAALVLESLAEEGLSLSRKAASFPRYFIVKEKVALKGDFAIAEKSLIKRFAGRVTAIDGIRIDMESGWLHMRKSNTEPVVRIIAEARSIREALSLVREAGRRSTAARGSRKAPPRGARRQR
ncbi:MAG: phosphoglucosamine mutase, partial [Candidatus Krumholzibacteria bacterium]|nr:phosphoglucosamine mutase [Candidatus Krumholzibacteria bacterium]